MPRYFYMDDCGFDDGAFVGDFPDDATAIEWATKVYTENRPTTKHVLAHLSTTDDGHGFRLVRNFNQRA